jgi:hypothetical protein
MKHSDFIIREKQNKTKPQYLGKEDIHDVFLTTALENQGAMI